MKTAWGWSAKLTRLIVLKDGTRLVTLGDVRAFILKQPEHIQERGSWQHAAELMILAAERGGNIEAAPLRLKTLCFWKRGTCGSGTDGAQPASKRPRSAGHAVGRYPEQAAAARDAVATEGDPNDVTEQTYHHHRAR